MLGTGDVIADRYQVVSLLGEGGMARVYRVRHNTLGGDHALKLLSFQHPRLQQRLLREGRIQAQLNHPNVVKVTDVLEHEGQTGLLMEYVPGITLDNLLNQRGMLFDEAIGLISQVLAGVTHAHDAGVLHRDLKPANVLLAPRPGSTGIVAKVTDFGIAKVLEPEAKKGMTRMGALMGTPGYMAPEQARDSASVDARADVFALGVIVYEIISGSPPYLAEDVETAIAMANEGDWPPLHEVVPDCPEGVSLAVQRALATDREDRFPDAYAFGAALLEHRPDLVATLRGETAPPSITLSGVQLESRVGPTIEPAASDEPLEDLLAGPSPQRSAVPFLLLLAAGSAGLVFIAPLMLYFLSGGEPTETNAPPVPTLSAPAPKPEEARFKPVPADAPEDRPAPAVEAPLPEAADAPKPSPIASPRPAPAAASIADAPPDAPAATPSTAASGTQTNEAEPDDIDADAPVADADGTADELPPSEPPPLPEAAAAPAAPSLLGSWSGTAANRPLSFQIATQTEGGITANVTITVGPIERTDAYTGTISADGAFTLKQEGGALTVFQGRLTGETLSGTYTARGSRRPQQWSVSRD